MTHFSKYPSLDAFKEAQAELSRSHVAIIESSPKPIIVYGGSNNPFSAHVQGESAKLPLGTEMSSVQVRVIRMSWDLDFIDDNPYDSEVVLDGKLMTFLVFPAAAQVRVYCTREDGEIPQSRECSIWQLGFYATLITEDVIRDMGEQLRPYLGMVMAEAPDVDSYRWTINSLSATMPRPRNSSTLNANGYGYVDLGLPSGRLWATQNIGASEPEEVGLYFNWAGITGYRDRKECGFYPEDAAYNQKGIITKYHTGLNSPGCTDGLLELQLSDDAARVNMGGDWRMPSVDDIVELTLHTSISRIDTEKGRCLELAASNGARLLLPLSGFISSGEFEDSGESILWSRSLCPYRASAAIDLFAERSDSFPDYMSRAYGLNIRGVM